MNKIIVIAIWAFLMNCHLAEKKGIENKFQNQKIQKLCDGVFQSNDSAGLVKSRIVAVEDTSNMGGSVIIVTVDKNKTERQFHGFYSKTKGLDIKILQIGKCIELDYYAEIEREDGVEVNRLYNLKEIRYLE